MNILDICWARLSECRTESAVDKVQDETWDKIYRECGHSVTAAKLNTQVLYLGRDRREAMKRKR